MAVRLMVMALRGTKILNWWYGSKTKVFYGHEGIVISFSGNEGILSKKKSRQARRRLAAHCSMLMYMYTDVCVRVVRRTGVRAPYTYC
jgi:hypothetical protein